MIRHIFSVLLFALFSTSALTVEPVVPLGGWERPADLLGLALDQRYQIGSEWGKKVVTRELFNQQNDGFKRMAQATARVGGATGFFIGEFDGKLVVATNNHVIRNDWGCRRASVRFEFLNIRTRCAEVFGTWPAIDLALIKIEVPAADRAKLLRVARNFSFRRDIQRGGELMTIGYGSADNPRRNLVANQDSDCRTFSDTGEYRLMGDPDALNPGPHRVWSFSNGCDVSHGDSGSAMALRGTGEVVGIIWTGKIPKNARVQDSAYLTRMEQTRSEEIWTELSYAVPAKKIGDYLTGITRDSATSEDLRRLLLAVLR
jgi:hypothetical protein